MTNLFVQKIIARDGERETLESSAEEMQTFIVEERRPEFEDNRIICIKFRTSYFEGDDTYEDTDWYINPNFCEHLGIDLDVFNGIYAYGPKMDSLFVPEILFIDPQDIKRVLRKYYSFNAKLFMTHKNDLSEEKRYEKFVSSYRRKK